MTETTFKNLKKSYYSYLFTIVVLMIISAFIIAKFDLAESIAILNTSSALKTVQMIITLFGIPGIFGLFTKQVENIKQAEAGNKFEAYVKSAKLRMQVIGVIFFINAVVYFLISEQSQLIMVAITAFVFLFIRPSKSRINGDLGVGEASTDETTNDN